MAVPAARAPVPSVVAPSINVTVPVEAAPLTVALKVTEVPLEAGFRLDARVVLEETVPTVWVSVAEVDPALLVSPPYTAVRLWAPVLNVAMERVATPELTVPVPTVVAPSWKVTVPVGVAPPMVAVNVVLPPKTLGFTLEAMVTVVVFWLTT